MCVINLVHFNVFSCWLCKAALPIPSLDPSGTSLNARRCSTFISLWGWHEINKMAAARAAPDLEEGIRGPRLPSELEVRLFIMQPRAFELLRRWLDRENDLPPWRVRGMPGKVWWKKKLEFRPERKRSKLIYLAVCMLMLNDSQFEGFFSWEIQNCSCVGIYFNSFILHIPCWKIVNKRVVFSKFYTIFHNLRQSIHFAFKIDKFLIGLNQSEKGFFLEKFKI